MPRKSLAGKSEELLRETRQLRARMLSFRRCADEVAEPLDRIVSDAEAAAMESARANILGTLENLLNQEIGPFLRQLEELDGHLESELHPKAKAARSSPAVAAKAVRLRRS